MRNPCVSILMGSDCDLPAMQATFKVLKPFDISNEVRVHSAHRSPEATHAYLTGAEKRGCQAFTYATGLAAQIMAVNDADLAQKLRDERDSNKKNRLVRNEEVQKGLGLV